jgi:2-polyprenyl-6-methoxyphenol hydroxylase-like FAD-dependent oxidoreductase
LSGLDQKSATLALLLVKRGIAVKLIESSRNFRRVFRGEGLMPSGLDALEQMELSSVLESIPHRPLDAWEVLIENRFLFRVDEPIEPGGKPCTLVSQPAFLEAVIDQASTYPNFEFIQGSPVQDLLWSDGRVSGVKLGDDRTISANLVIGADGRNSVVRQRANIPLEQQSGIFDILWFKLADSPRFESEAEVPILLSQSPSLDKRTNPKCIVYQLKNGCNWCDLPCLLASLLLPSLITSNSYLMND